MNSLPTPSKANKMSDIPEFQNEYEVVTPEGEWCAGSTSLEDARHYAMIYGQDGPVNIVWVRKMIVERYPSQAILNQTEG